MPYIENRIVHDADSHTMELPNWYKDYGSKKNLPKKKIELRKISIKKLLMKNIR